MSGADRKLRRWAVTSCVLGAACLLAPAAPATAASGRPTWRTISSSVVSGSHDGSGDRIQKAWADDIQVDDAAWLRVVFSQANLGKSSYILLRGPNGEQRLDATTLAEWSNGSAVFAGDRVPIELHVAPEDRGISIRIESVMAGDPGPGIETLCGTDNRVASGDNRVGRLFQMGCTAWQIPNGAFLTAGHCADLDPDNTGPMLPNGVLDLNGVLEFNVPASQASGAMVAAAVNDQYPVDVSSVAWRFDGENQGLGKDWCVFRVGRNSNTLLFPWQANGTQPFRVTRELPTDVEAVRVTGFGTDGGTANQTNQTSTGGFAGETASGADIRVDHTVDTMGGNSGSPVIWDFMNLTFGIHTNGGCTGTGGSNAGTSFEVDALENAINDYPGVNTLYADQLHPLRVAEEGTLFRPFASLALAIAATPTTGIVSMNAGFYGLPSGTVLNRAMTLQAPVGGVVIVGN